MRRTLLLAIFIISGISAFSQYQLEYHRNTDASKRAGTAAPGETLSSGFTGTGANINVIYNRINWTINPNDASKTVAGNVTVYFKTIQANVSALSFDFRKSSFNNTATVVTYHGNTCSRSFPASGTVNILNITLPSTIAAINTLDSITIAYSGAPPAVSGTAQGYQRDTHTDSIGVMQYYTGSLSESYEDRDWWPCKADMQDKIDSMDISVTVPWSGADTFWVAANGKMVDSAISGSNRTFKFKTRYPIASYLVSLSVGRFNRYYRSVNVNGTIVPVTYNLLRGRVATYYQNAVAAMDKINLVLAAFSDKIGEYPFKLEKHGFYDGLKGAGGMEHQTFSGIAAGGTTTSLATLTHELMHQWFGDNVSFATWNDLWLAEGFARYSESLFAELVPSLGVNPLTSRSSVKSAALSLDAASAWIPDANIGTSNLIWGSSYGSTVYDRGCMIVSMLRTLAGDSIFFETLTKYQTDLAGKSATTDTIRNYFNRALGQDISEFFRDYVGGSGNGATAVGGIGNPVYDIKWGNPQADRLTLRVNSQTQSSGSNVTYFNGPVTVRVKGASSGDTTIVFYDWGNGNLSYAGNGLSAPIPGNLLSYDLSFVPNTVLYDDSARTLSTGSAANDPALVGYVWSGPTSTAWTTTSNWSACCGVPPTNVDVTIATTTNAPTLPGPVTVRSLTLNTGKVLNIGANTLTINGTIFGTGTLTGSTTSNLIINEKAGLLNFTQISSATRSLNSLTLNKGSQAQLANTLEAKAVTVTRANFTINTGVSLITK